MIDVRLAGAAAVGWQLLVSQWTRDQTMMSENNTSSLRS